MAALWSQLRRRRPAQLGGILLLALALVMPSTSRGGPLQSLGLKVGASLTDQSLRLASGREHKGAKAHRGLAAGVFAEWGLPGTDQLSLVTEAVLIEKGLDHRAWSYDAKHVAFPVLARLALLRGHASPYFIVGPSLEFVDELAGGAYDDDHFVLSWHVGGGVAWKGAVAEFRYARDQTQEFEATDLVPETRASSGWILQVGYQLSVPAANGQ